MFFSFFCVGGGRGHQPGEGTGEKLANEEGVIINFITNSDKPSNPISPPAP